MITITPITRAIAKAEADKYPTLTGNGFNYARFASDGYTGERQRQDREDLWSDDGRLQIACAIQYTREKRVLLNCGSYSYKHEVERWASEIRGHTYISNGCCILGFSIAGYTIQLIEDSPNCFFNKRRAQ